MEKIMKQITSLVEQERIKPLSVTIMGQTGVGKSSLLNSLFNSQLKTDHIAPCTKEVQKIVVKGESGHEIHFYDMPGIGESDHVDTKYIKWYANHLLKSDIVLWAIHIDNRSITFDINSFKNVLNSIDIKQNKSDILRKLTIVLTKADTFFSPPWILAKYKKYGVFTPTKATRIIFENKEEYYQKIFYDCFKKYLKAKTTLDEEFNINEDGFNVRNDILEYNGYLNAKQHEFFVNKYPKQSLVFDRIYDNFRVVSVSGHFRFNLILLMKVIVNKIGNEAVLRFSKYTSNSKLNNLDFNVAKSFSNIIIFDTKLNKKIFDLNDLDF